MEKNIISRENFENTKSFLNQINDLAVSSNENILIINQNLMNAKNLISEVGNIYLESKRVDNEKLKLKNELASIVLDFKIKQSYIANVFAERSKIIDKHFEVIDRGLLENNDELVLQGLRGASEFVSTNPLDNFDNFRNILLNKNTPLELDF